MKNKVLSYRIIVETELQGLETVYVAYAPSLGLSDFGSSVDIAVTNVEHAIKLYLETLLELKEPVPQPDSDNFYVTTKSIKLDVPALV